MNDRETRRYDMFGRVKTFGTDNAADFAAGGEAQKRFANVGKVITDLDAAKAAQQGSGTTAKEVLLDALRLDLQNISRTARAIAQDTAGFADTFRPPDSPSQTALLTTADAFLAQFQFATDDTAAQKSRQDRAHRQVHRARTPRRFRHRSGRRPQSHRRRRGCRRERRQRRRGKHRRRRTPHQSRHERGQLPRRHHAQQIHAQPRQAPRMGQRQPHRTRPAKGKEGSGGFFHTYAAAKP